MYGICTDLSIKPFLLKIRRAEVPVEVETTFTCSVQSPVSAFPAELADPGAQPDPQGWLLSVHEREPAFPAMAKQADQPPLKLIKA